MEDGALALLRSHGLQSIEALGAEISDIHAKLIVARNEKQDRVVGQLEKKIESRERLQKEIAGE